MPDRLDPASLVVEADRVRANGEPLAPSPVFASTYRLAGDPAAGPPGYGRFHNPGWSELETLLGRLDGGAAVAFPSGMAASVAALEPFLAPGDRLVMAADGYYTTRRFAETVLARRGVAVAFVPTAGLDGVDLAGCRLLWLETPSNPGLDVCDVAELAARAHAAGARVVVDNTTATPLGQTPMALGADLVVSADTKAVAGHSDVLFGHVTARDPADAETIRDWRKLTGAVPGAMATFLVHRGLATLDVRLERMSRNADRLARFLAGHPRVEAVRYPGLEADPAHALAARQMRGFGFLLGVTFVDVAAARAFLAGTALVTEATSFGGVHTTAEQRTRWGGDAVPERFVRLSAGIEAAADLVADIERALA
ncbi:MAG: cystathionine gamma-lyase [Alphaproteobacteria bacterium]